MTTAAQPAAAARPSKAPRKTYRKPTR
jgi:hypothetical protein